MLHISKCWQRPYLRCPPPLEARSSWWESPAGCCHRSNVDIPLSSYRPKVIDRLLEGELAFHLRESLGGNGAECVCGWSADFPSGGRTVAGAGTGTPGEVAGVGVVTI